MISRSLRFISTGIKSGKPSPYNFVREVSQVTTTEQDQHTLLPYLHLYGYNSDNIGYVLREPQTNQLIAVDVGESEKSANIIFQLEKMYDSKLAYILCTHKHHDHIGGNEFWLKERPELKILGSTREPHNIPGLETENAMSDLQSITIGDLCICCMETPGHTTDHCSFIITHVTPVSNKNPFLFCGDTMFVAGAGRLLGGTAL